MHGSGNSYIHINCFEEQVENPAALAVRMSDKNFGVGADGIILIKPSGKVIDGSGARADCFMEIYNADGSQAEMCGNGIRCVAKFMYDNRLVSGTVINVDTLSGVKRISLTVGDGVCTAAEVNMGRPILEAADIPCTLVKTGAVLDHKLDVCGRTLGVTCVSMGNPHCIVVVDDPWSFPVEVIGPALERHPAFPARVNVSFISLPSTGGIKVRTWERGSGETLACGTGNCASLVAATLLGLCGGEADTFPAGGKLHIRWDRDSDEVCMTGPAEAIFSGEWSI
jgi:diaminopimelate epimerase